MDVLACTLPKRVKAKRIRVFWYEYCQNCSIRWEWLQIGTEMHFWCKSCGHRMILDELTPNRPE